MMLASRLRSGGVHNVVGVHLYSFGGAVRTAEWMNGRSTSLPPNLARPRRGGRAPLQLSRRAAHGGVGERADHGRQLMLATENVRNVPRSSLLDECAAQSNHRFDLGVQAAATLCD